MAECKKAIIELYGADPKNNPDYSRIISARAVERLAALIDAAKVVAGGESDEDRRYVAPTVPYPVSWSDPIMESESFGPLLPVLPYTDLGAAFAQVKSVVGPARRRGGQTPVSHGAKRSVAPPARVINTDQARIYVRASAAIQEEGMLCAAGTGRRST